MKAKNHKFLQKLNGTMWKLKHVVFCFYLHKDFVLFVEQQCLIFKHISPATGKNFDSSCTFRNKRVQ